MCLHWAFVRCLMTAKITDFNENIVCEKFCFILEKTAAAMMQEIWNNLLVEKILVRLKPTSGLGISKWHISVDDDKHPGHSLTSITDANDIMRLFLEKITEDHLQVINIICKLLDLLYNIHWGQKKKLLFAFLTSNTVLQG